MDTNSEPGFLLFSSLRFDPRLVESDPNTSLDDGPSPFYMLPFHRDRVLQAAIHFKWPAAIIALSGPEGLQRLNQKLKVLLDSKSTTPLRVRIIINHSGDITIENNPTPPVPLRNLFPTHLPSPGKSEMRVSARTGGALTLGIDDVVQQGSGYGDPEQKEAWTVLVDPAKTPPSPFTTYKTTSRDMYTEARERVGIRSMTDAKEVLIISTKNDEIMEGSLTSVLFWRQGRWVTPPVASGGQAGTTRRWLLEKKLCEEEIISTSSLVDREECWISNGVRGLIWGKIKI